MNKLPSKATIEYLRSVYKKGTRVELECMDDLQAPPKGTRGTVLFVDDIGSIHVRWDNGSTLAIAYGIDSAGICSTSDEK